MELKEGDYWYFKDRNNRLNEEFIVKKGVHICINTRYYCTSVIDWTLKDNMPVYSRPANLQEIAHLNACIAANKYVECPKKINSNELLKYIVIW